MSDMATLVHFIFNQEDQESMERKGRHFVVPSISL